MGEISKKIILLYCMSVFCILNCSSCMPDHSSCKRQEVFYTDSIKMLDISSIEVISQHSNGYIFWLKNGNCFFLFRYKKSLFYRSMGEELGAPIDINNDSLNFANNYKFTRNDMEIIINFIDSIGSREIRTLKCIKNRQEKD